MPPDPAPYDGFKPDSVYGFFDKLDNQPQVISDYTKGTLQAEQDAKLLQGRIRDYRKLVRQTARQHEDANGETLFLNLGPADAALSG